MALWRNGLAHTVTACEVLGSNPRGGYYWKYGRVVMQQFAKLYIGKKVHRFESYYFRKKNLFQIILLTFVKKYKSCHIN